MSGINLSAKHTAILQTVVKHMGTTSIDWDTIALETSCKTGKYARDQFAIIRNKLGAKPTENASASAGTPNKKGSGGKKRKAADEDATPVGKKGAKKVKATAGGDEEEVAADDDEEEGKVDSPVKDEPKDEDEDGLL